MSLGCGQCRKTIFGYFGLLYRFEIVAGDIRRPTADLEYVPPNSAVCEPCWAQIPESDHVPAPALDRPFVYGFAWSSSLEGAGGAAQWSSIFHGDRYVFISPETVQQFLPKALVIIDYDSVTKTRSRNPTP